MLSEWYKIISALVTGVKNISWVAKGKGEGGGGGGILVYKQSFDTIFITQK